MYSLGMPVSAIRTKIRHEFEKHRYVQQLSAVDVLLYKSHAEFQVCIAPPIPFLSQRQAGRLIMLYRKHLTSGSSCRM